MTAASAVPADIRAAYQHCEQVTSTQARNFSYGIRLLPAPKRRALSAVYAFARRIDDIGDGTLPAAQKLTALQEARQQLAALADDVARGGPAAAVQAETGQTGTSPARTSPNGTSPNGTSLNGTGQTGTSQTGTSPNETSQAGLGQAGASQNEAGPAGHPADLVLVALGDAAGRYPIPLAAFGELIEGCEADVRGTAYATFSDLEHYCRCVAGSIGRLSLGIFGSRELDRAVPLADALGIALQLTNILRDIREDYGTGRVYLPAEDLASFGCALTPAAQGGPAELPASPALERLVRYQAQRALRWYCDGLALLPLLDRRSAACTGAMAGIYLRLLERISADPAAALAHRMSLPGRAKAAVAVRSLAGQAPRPRTAGRSGAPGPDPMTAQEARP